MANLRTGVNRFCNVFQAGMRLLLLLLIQEMLMMSVAHRSLWGLRKMQLPSIAL